jgi:uncharacterized repeat protein (TIGR01451 family)
VTAGLTNTGNVTGDPVGGGTAVTDTDDTEVTVTMPAITIDKDDADNTDDTQAVLPGGTATFTITVTNTGDVDLENVTVTDPLAPNCDMVIGNLAVGASTDYTCTLANVTAGLTNIGNVTGDPVGGGTAVTDTDDTEVTILAPSISIVKDDNDNNDDTQAVSPGGTATFSITVTNTGGFDLENVAVTDPLSPGCDMVIGNLAVGASTNYTCTATNVTAGFTNTANVTGDPVGGGPAVMDTDDTQVTLLSPSISIDKDDADNTDDTQAVNPGGTATFTITVTNTGDVDLENVTVTDPLSPNCDMVIGNLAVGASTNYTCTLANVTAALTNIGNVTGNPVGGGTAVTDTDDTEVTVTMPAITIDKDDADNTDDTQMVNPGGTATFTITVTNTGDVDLENVAVTDPLAPNCDMVIGNLAVGASTNYTCTSANVMTAFINTADVTGDPVGGGTTVTDTDDTQVTLNMPSISIIKDDADDSDDTQAVSPNGTATFTITVMNTGNTDLENVVVTDPMSPACDMVIGNLAIGATVNYTCMIDNVTTAFTNTASVTGDPVGGGTMVMDTDDTEVTIANPDISVVKDDADNSDDTQIVAPDGTATFTITVTNTGDIDLVNVVVTDPLAPNCDNTISNLAVGQIVTYTCTLDNVTASFTNTVDVVGTPDDGGDNVMDTDDSEVVQPNLTADKTSTFVDANADNQLNPGEQVDYTIVLTNSGDGDALAVMFSDMIPTGTTYVPATLMTSQGTVDDSGDPLTGDLGIVAANGGTVTITFSVTVNDPFNNPSGAIENQGVFTSTNHPDTPTDDPIVPTNDPTDPGDPGDPTVNPVAQPFLLSTKTSDFDDANMDGILNPTEQLNYTIVLTNSGPGDALNVTFSDMIPVGVTYVAGTLMTSQGTVDDSGDPLTGILGTVPANGGSVTITFSVTVNNPFTNDPAIIENQATFSSDNHPIVTSDDPTDPTNNPANPGDPVDPTLDPVGTQIIVVSDPCNCLDNESEVGDDGQFSEVITLMGPANQTWTILSVDGLFSATSPAPPAAPVPYSANFQLTETSPGTYVLEGIHVDAVGFTVTLTDGINVITVPDVGRNTCFYPEGALLGLASSYCADDLATAAVTANLTGNPTGTITNFEIVGETDFTVNGNTLSFVPSDLAAGTYTVRYEFDAEDATVNDPTDPGCMILLEETFIVDEELMILCRPPVSIAAEENCNAANPGILPPVVIGGGVGNLTVSNNAPVTFPMGTTTVSWTINDGNGCAATCTQTVTVFDNEPPTIDCGNAFYANTSWENCGYPSTLLEGPSVSDNCGILNITNDAPAFFPPGMYMPTWTVTDVNGNTASCMQWVTVNDTTLPKITSCPEDIEVEAITANGAPVTWTQPQAMDNCPGDIIWVSTHDSGDLFPLGTTQVTYTAYDQNGQFIDCDFTVTVMPIGDPLVTIAGMMATEFDETIQDVEVHINGQMTDMYMTSDDGMYNFSVPFNGDYSMSPEKDNNYLNGVSTYDLVLISKHILGDQLLDSPYKMIAADANKSNSISTLDLVQIQKLILLIDSELINNTSWRFINKDFVFADPANPFGEDFPEVINFNNLAQSALNADFIGVKIGDVNGNAIPNNLLGVDDRTGETALKLQTKNLQMEAGESYEILINANDFDHLGFQFTLDFDVDKVEFNDIDSDLAKADNFGLTLLEEGAITVSWFAAENQKLAIENAAIRLTLTAKVETTLAEVLSINSKFISAEAYANNGDLQTVDLYFDNTNSTDFKLYQNVPNPFSKETFIGFDLPNASPATLVITDVSGRVVYRTTGDFAKGYNRIELTKNDLPTNGVWYYQLKTATDFASGKMILIRE